MTIAICGSITFYETMLSIEAKLKNLGHTEVFVPEDFRHTEMYSNDVSVTDARLKIEFNLIKKHWEKIKKADCILVVNNDKSGIKGYIGGNTFLEMGFAFVLGKKIFLLNPVPIMPYTSEIVAMQPIVINGELERITI